VDGSGLSGSAGNEPDYRTVRGKGGDARHADRIGEEYWGVPDIVVEVISPRTPKSSGTEHTDRGEKFVEYAKAGVQEYWLIHPTDCTIEIYVLRDGVYHLLDRWSEGKVARSKVLDGLEVPVETVVQGNSCQEPFS